ncbi:MAG: TRAP transporter large permease [Firmicutes bacterium]|nr:TRAP transporter large permease [Bacillota bacterium]
MTVAVVGIAFFVLLVIGVPIAFAVGWAALSGLLHSGVGSLIVVPQRLFTGLDSFPIMAIPFFVAAGYIMNDCDLTDQIVQFSKSLVGHITGGLAHVNIAASMFFAGISGSAVADTAAIGGMLIPSMVKQGYDRDFSAAVTATSSVMAPIIPPSIPAVILAVMTGVSVGAVFAAGVLPGLLIGMLQMGVAYLFSRKHHYRPNNRWEGWGNVGRQFLKAAPALVMPFIILGGVLSGVFTATEAGAVAVVYGLAIGLATRKITARSLWKILVRSAVTSSVILVVIGAANLLNWVIATQQVPAMVRNYLDSAVTSRAMMLALLNVVFLVAGMLLEGIAAMTLLVPILLPAAVAWGIDPLLFTVMALINLNLGLVTPPVALCLYLAADIAERRAETVFVKALPFIGALVVVMLLVTYVPGFTLYLPRLLGL